ncbi:PaaI family thioesterase [Sorangium sp. So ce131]
MIPRDPGFTERTRALFDATPFLRHLGAELVRCEPGRCEARLRVAPWQLQQDGFIHAGVQATLADHTAGAAAGTLLAADEVVLTVELKINLLRPALGEELRCAAVVLRPGARITVAEAEVFARRGAEEKLTAKAMITLTSAPTR